MSLVLALGFRVRVKVRIGFRVKISFRVRVSVRVKSWLGLGLV